MSKAHINSKLNIQNTIVGLSDSVQAYFPFEKHANDVLFGAEPITNLNTTITTEGIAIEEATTNLCSNPATLAGWNVWNHSSRTPYEYIDHGTYTEIKFTSNSDLDTAYGIKQTITGITAGSNYTWSVYTSADKALLDSVVTYISNSQHYIEIVWLNSTGTTIETLNTTSQVRITDNIIRWVTSGTAPTGATQATVRCELDSPNLPSGKSLSIYMPQLEKKSFPTSFINGSRGAGRIDIPFNLKPPYTVRLKHKANKPLNLVVDQSSSPMILQLNGYYANASISFWNYSKNLTLYVKGNSSAGWTSSKGYISYTTAEWDNVEHEYVIVVVDNRTFKVYMDGIYLGEQISSEDVTNITYLSMGNTSMPNAIYRDLSLHDRALSDNEINILHNSTFNYNSEEGACT